MARELTLEEKALIEREFVAKQEAACRRRRFARSVFAVGITAGILAAIFRGFDARGFVTSLLWLVWVVSLLIYVGGHLLPTSLSKDLDPSWHLNPWQDALANLSEGRTIREAIALLAGPKVILMCATFLYLSIK